MQPVLRLVSYNDPERSGTESPDQALCPMSRCSMPIHRPWYAWRNA